MQAQHGHSAAHLLETAVGFAPLEQSTRQSRQLGARAARVVGNQGAQLPDLLAADAAAAVAFSSRLPAGRSTPVRSAGPDPSPRAGIGFSCGGARFARFGAGFQIGTQPAWRVDLPQL